MNNIIHKRFFIFSLFLALVFSGCSVSSSNQDTENTSSLDFTLQFPEIITPQAAKAVKALNADPNSVASLTLGVTDQAGTLLTSTTISVTPNALVSISFDVPLGRALSINATLLNVAGKPLFKGRSIPLDFERGRSQSLTIVMNFIQSLLGSWLLVEDNGLPVGGGADPGVLTFISSTEYFMADDNARFQDCSVGMEHGFYSWNVFNDILNVTGNIVDTSGGCGLNDPTEGLLSNVKLTVNNDTLLLVDSDGESAKLTRVKSDTNPLIGVWVGTNDVSSSVITFVSDTEYFFADDHSKDPVSCGGVSPKNSGMEHGTYTHNPTTGAFSVTSNIFDTNGACGLNNPPTNSFANATLTIQNDTLVLTDPLLNETFHFSRVNFADYFPIALGKSWKYQNAADPTDTFTDTVEAISFGGKAAFKVGETQEYLIVDNDGTSFNILALFDEGLLVNIPDVSMGIISDQMVFNLDSGISGSTDTVFRFWDNINPAVKGIYGIDPSLNDLIVWVFLDKNHPANSHNNALGIPASLGAVTDISWYQKGVGGIVYIDIDAAAGTIVSHYDLVDSG